MQILKIDKEYCFFLYRKNFCVIMNAVRRNVFIWKKEFNNNTYKNQESELKLWIWLNTSELFSLPKNVSFWIKVWNKAILSWKVWNKVGIYLTQGINVYIWVYLNFKTKYMYQHRGRLSGLTVCRQIWDLVLDSTRHGHIQSDLHLSKKHNHYMHT